MTSSCSACVRVADSPVEPHGTIPSTPDAISHSTSSRSALTSTAPSRNGVIIAEIAPLNMTLASCLAGRFQFGIGDFDFALEDFDRFAGHENVIRLGSAVAPFDLE